MSERLERVERFEELRPGIIVVVKPCLDCGGQHRAMLTTRFEGLARRPPRGEVVLGVGWNYLPPSPCDQEPFEILSSITVDRGAVFRVLDGLEEPSTETAAAARTARPKEKADVLRR